MQETVKTTCYWKNNDKQPLLNIEYDPEKYNVSKTSYLNKSLIIIWGYVWWEPPIWFQFIFLAN